MIYDRSQAYIVANDTQTTQDHNCTGMWQTHQKYHLHLITKDIHKPLKVLLWTCYKPHRPKLHSDISQTMQASVVFRHVTNHAGLSCTQTCHKPCRPQLYSDMSQTMQASVVLRHVIKTTRSLWCKRHVTNHQKPLSPKTCHKPSKVFVAKDMSQTIKGLICTGCIIKYKRSHQHWHVKYHLSRGHFARDISQTI